MWLKQLLENRLALSPDAVSVGDEASVLSWREFDAQVARRMAFVVAGTDRLDRVAYLASGRKEHFELLFACACTGRTFVPLNPSLTPREIAHQIALVSPRMLIVESGSERLATEAVAELEAAESAVAVVELDAAVASSTDSSSTPLADDEPAIVFFTSATTGRSKGVEVPERSLMTNALAWALDVLPNYGPARFLSACPLFHGSSVVALDYLAAGRPVYILPRFTPRSWLASVDRWRITHTFLVPTMVDLVLQLPDIETAKCDSLELIGHGAAPMPQELAERCRKILGVRLHSVYGITEGGGPVVVAPLPAAQTAPATGATPIGVPMTGVEVRLVTEDGSASAVGEPGELYLRWPGVMTGYWRNAEATADAFAEGWLRTRDVALVDEAGLYWILDRRTDLILRGGQNVYPAELETVIRQLPGVANVAVVGAPSTMWGQTPVAFVSVVSGTELMATQVIQWCAGRLASYKLPSKIYFIDQIPVNPSGKVLRRELRARVGKQ